MASIPLTQGLVTVVDDEDYEWLSQWRWKAHVGERRLYAERSDNTRGSVRMHRVILEAPPGMTVDHIDHDGLNNTRANLRLATTLENSHNQRLASHSTSGFKGVTYHKGAKKWMAQITVSRRHIYLNLHDTAEEAARAYDAAAREHFGQFAHCNFPGAAVG